MGAGDAAGLAWVLGVGGGLGSIALTGWLVFVVVDGYRRRQQIRAATELQLRLLERIGSAHEFAQFLSTEAGSRFLDAISVDRRTAQLAVLRALQLGVVAAVVGMILLAVSGSARGGTGAGALGLVCAAVGAGLMVSSAVAYRVARHMGLLSTGAAASNAGTRGRA